MHSHLADANGSLQRARSRPVLPRSRRFVPQRSFDRDRGASCAKDNVFGGLDALLGWCILGGLTLVAPPPGGGVKVDAFGVQLSSREPQHPMESTPRPVTPV